MPQASKSKSRKGAKEPAKGSGKPSGHVNTSGGILTSGYNPLLGTFHTFDTTPVSSTIPVQVNGRFRNIDDTDDHNGNSNEISIETDSISNNGSWSGDSEGHKEKTSHPQPRQDSVPGADNDKKEKIRRKNEKKHQRQKERRAQELHERCSGYLMSRKLETLAQQFVAMGFSQERATMALIMNEGRVEDSVTCLFELAEEKKTEHSLDGGGGNLKIDISDELARIADLEIKYKASKQEVERAIVASEGDLKKAEDILKDQKVEPPKPEETSDPHITVALSQNTIKLQTKPTASISIQRKRDGINFNYAKVPATGLRSSTDPGTKSVQVLKRVQQKLERAQPQQIVVPAEKMWPSPTKPETRFVADGNDIKHLQLGSVKEPVILMQRPQSINEKQTLSSKASSSSSPPVPGMGWYSNSIETIKPNGFVPPVTVSRNISPVDISSNTMYNQFENQGTSKGNGLWSRGGQSPTLAPASSLGLFCGSSGSGSPVEWSDWIMGSSTVQFDYANVDWSVDQSLLTSRSNALWNGANYSMPNAVRKYDPFSYRMGLKSSVEPVLSNGNDGGSQNWTSPFEEKDIFSLPIQFISYPSL